MKELLRKLRKYEIQIRKAITTQMQGDFHSVFKGTGLEYEDVRSYQYGDDVRSIDWNVSAKGHGTYVRTYREEKEQSVFLVLDVSASQEIGLPNQQKLDVGREICGILALSAVKQSSQVGVICFSSQKEWYLPADKGIKHAYNIIKSIYDLKPKSISTNLAGGIKMVLGLLKRRSITILISDFIDQNYQRELKTLAKRHDLVVIQLYDKRDEGLPQLGIVPLFDKEAQRVVWVNTSSAAFRNSYEGTYAGNRKELEQLCRKYNANYLAINT
ncbi:MAG: DUF58 domain-containing protein, partial [Sphingobacteriales bacterium]